jgi:hypothetical protein
MYQVKNVQTKILLFIGIIVCQKLELNTKKVDFIGKCQNLAAILDFGHLGIFKILIF